MSYIGYDKKKKKFYVIKRPTNQSHPDVLKKIAKRLKKLIDDGVELNDLQKIFLRDIEKSGTVKLKDKGIDVAHNIAISVIMDAMVDRMNNPQKDDEVATEFFDVTLSTVDDPGKQKAKDFFNNLGNPKRKIQDKLDDANELAKKVNCASKNLMPGHYKTNRSIQNKRDPHLVKDDDGYIETENSKKISKSFDAFRGKPYKPKSRKGKEGAIEYQSSSISNITTQAFFAPRGELSTRNKEERLGKEMLQKGDELFSFVCKREAKGEELLELPEYEHLCELINDLSELKNKRFYNELAMKVSGLQLCLEAAYDRERYGYEGQF